jgi:hypothetical protein
VTISRPAKELKLRIYTTAFRRVLETAPIAANTREAIITVPQLKISRFAAGAYYIVVNGVSVDDEKAVSKPKALIILK